MNGAEDNGAQDKPVDQNPTATPSRSIAEGSTDPNAPRDDQVSALDHRSVSRSAAVEGSADNVTQEERPVDCHPGQPLPTTG